MERDSATPPQVARVIGLVYVSDQKPGIGRTGSAPRFRYRAASGEVIRDPETLRRIRSLAIPPAWKDVWICTHENGHIQAVGRDQRGRKQYRYHPRWREARDATKFMRMVDFAKALPRIRRQVARDLHRKGLPREKVLAAVVNLLESTLIRVGNDEYAQHNRSYGLTTLRNRHARVRGEKITFDFVGKRGIRHRIDVRHPRLARIVRRCQDLPGQELFAYIDETGAVCDVTSNDVNDYLRAASAADFTAKDFRTWAGTVLAAIALREFENWASMRQAKRNITMAVEAVAHMLGNTAAICRKCYVHPAVVDSYLRGESLGKPRKSRSHAGCNLRADEAAVVALLKRASAVAARSRDRTRSARTRPATKSIAEI